jgi:hypothetical protein
MKPEKWDDKTMDLVDYFSEENQEKVLGSPEAWPEEEDENGEMRNL